MFINVHVHEHILVLRGLILYLLSDEKGREKEQKCGKELSVPFNSGVTP